MKLLAGTRLNNNKYEIKSCLGEGGFGITYLATDLQLDRIVVLKEYFPRFMVNRNVTETNNLTIFNNELLDFDKGLDRFLSEAKTLALLKDIPEIVTVYDFFKENNTAYIVMEYIQGQNLKQYIKKRQRPYTLDGAMAIMRPCMVALGKVHEAGLIHRDFTPDNIIISDKGVKIIDFGSSRDYVSNEATMTVMVKHGYAPAEQYSNEVKQGTYTDVYSVSAIIYEMLTLKKPTAALDRAMNDTLLPPSAFNESVDARQDNLVMRGLTVYYTGRYQTIGEMLSWYDASMYGSATEVLPRETSRSNSNNIRNNNNISNNNNSSNFNGNNSSQKAGTGKIIGIIAGIAAALVITGVGLFAALGGSSTNKSETKKTSNKEYDTDNKTEKNKKKENEKLDPAVESESVASESEEPSTAEKRGKFSVGICQLVEHPALNDSSLGFQDALIQELGDSVTFDVQVAGGDAAKCTTIVNDFISSDVDLILANTSASLSAAEAGSKEIPILGTSITDYGRYADNYYNSGIVGGNISGTTDGAPFDAMANVFTELLPDVRVVGFIYTSTDKYAQYQVEQVAQLLSERGIECKYYGFKDEIAISGACTEAVRSCDAIYIPIDNTLISNAEYIQNNCTAANIPVVCGDEATCGICGIATISINYYDLGYVTGKMAARVLKGEADISEMPVEFATKYDKVYNPENCEALGIKVPSDYIAVR